MPSQFRKYSVPSILAAGLAALVISACGGSSDDSGATELAKYAPADSPVFIEGAVQPSSDVAANVDSITETLAGVNVGDLIKDSISSDSDGEVDFDTDVQPWLGENAGIFVEFDPASFADSATGGGISSLTAEAGEPAITSYDPETDGEKYGLIVETTDADAAKAFIDKQIASDPDMDSTEGEYEGFSYTVEADGTTGGIVDDNLVMASTEDVFKSAIDASKGDNLADTDAFKDLSGKAADGALATVYTANDPYLAALKEQGLDFGGLYEALGISLEGSGTVVSLVPEADEISMKGYTNAGSDLTSGDPSALIETFPADSIVALGSGDVGSNATKIMDALNSEGIPGLLEPGQVDKAINEASGQIDIKGIVDSLETVAFFMNGTNERNLGGALVATSSNIEPIESSLRGISSLVGLAGDASVRPLPGGVAGFRVFTEDLPGRPVVIGVKDDRMVIGVGMKASLNALTGSGQTLADSDAYRAADASTEEAGLDMFADPANIAKLIVSEGAGEPEALEIAKIVRKFQFMAAGSSDSEGTFEFNMGLQE
ncbi:MAG: DUF3352 domain-containing protein [Solirubrobacterales bacterium]|nr:DUF3352 domain-containing protein [Solirubrobacterales bacterium]